jgi:hypothetical protein
MFFIFVKNKIDMVTVLKVNNEQENNEKIYSIYFQFIERYGFSIFDKMLIKTSSCDKYEYLYLFMNQDELNGFISLLLDENMTIHSKQDYTEKMLSIIVNNKLDEFKEQFEPTFDTDGLISLFYDSVVTKDDVLDKVNSNGFESLTEDDYRILNCVE